MAQLQFDANSVDTTNPFDTLPAGDYQVMVVASDVKPTKAGTGFYLELELEVVNGQHQGRRIWDRLNISNQNKTAEDIGQRQLSQLCHAVGVLNVGDSSELHDKPCIAKVVVKKSEQYGDQNEVKGYVSNKMTSASAAAPPAAPAQAAPAPATATAAADDTPPWLRK